MSRERIRERGGEAATGLAIVAPFLYWLYQYLNLDFWYDEIWSLMHFTFVPLSKTVTDYAVPNNHIFFNLIDNLYLKCVGVKDLYALMDFPYVIRLLPLGYTLLTLFFVYLIGRRHAGRLAGWLSVVVLATTVPYYNFAIQVRGYGLSILLLCVTWHLGCGLEERFRRSDCVLFVLGAALSLYTIPSNFYFLAAAGVFYACLGLQEARGKRPRARDKKKSARATPPEVSRLGSLWDRNRHLFIALLLGIGFLLATLMYLPVIGGVASVASARGAGLFHGPTLYDTAPTVFRYFLSQRYLLLPLAAAGLYLVLRKRSDPTLARRLFLCAAILVLPFLVSYVRGDRAIDRVFVVLTPVFAVLMAVCVSRVLGWIVPGPRGSWAAMALMFLYCNVTFAFAIDHIHRRLAENILQGKKAQDLYYNYYQAYYHPLRVFGEFARSYQQAAGPVIGCEGDGLAVPQYFKKFHITTYDCSLLLEMKDRPGKAARLGRAYVVSPVDVRKTFEKNPRFVCEKLTRQTEFHGIYWLALMAD